jgi:Tol biopolymer transport system component
LNSGPSFTSEQQPIYFSSSDTFPLAEPFISRVRLDGSSFTNLGETGEMLNLGESGAIYFVKQSEDNGKLQIYSVTSEGLQFSSVINDMQFTGANCFSPSVSLDGTKLLFVSDYHQDEKGRNNNNLYILDLSNGRIQQLTDNGSDDIAPMWSPTEPGIIYFLSNRGGVYNIWRMKVLDVN